MSTADEIILRRAHAEVALHEVREAACQALKAVGRDLSKRAVETAWFAAYAQWVGWVPPTIPLQVQPMAARYRLTRVAYAVRRVCDPLKGTP